MQKKLNSKQIEKFYHAEFVLEQIEHFKMLFYSDIQNIRISKNIVVDLGGGCGYFAKKLSEELLINTKVVDTDKNSIEKCRNESILSELGDASLYQAKPQEKIACLNLVLHHLVANTEKNTYYLQSKTIKNWLGHDRMIFVNEYIYESFIPGFSGFIIYKITKSKILSAVCKLISKLIPAFKANTFGVGVRFRSEKEWIKLFQSSGFHILGKQTGRNEKIALPLRLLLIKSINRNSYILGS